MTERPHHGGWLDVNNIWVVPESTLEAAEADRDRLEKQLEDLENEKAGCCIENEERADRLAARVTRLEHDLVEARNPAYQAWLASSEHRRLAARVAELEAKLHFYEDFRARVRP